MSWLKELGLKCSTLAAYCNGVVAVAGFALTLVSEDEQEECPLSELISLRKQAEGLSKQVRPPPSVYITSNPTTDVPSHTHMCNQHSFRQEQLFAVKSENWISWEQGFHQ